MNKIQFKLVIVLMELCLYFIEHKTINCAYVKFERVNSKGKPSFPIRVSVYDILAIINTVAEIYMEIQ